MKKITFWKSFFLLFALIVGSMNVWADSFNFVQTSTSAGNLTNAPSGVTATFSNTYTNNKEQITKDNTMTLTIKNLGESRTITGISLSLHNNKSSGAGSATAKIGNTTIGTLSNITGLGNSSYTNLDMTVTSTAASGDLIIILSCSENSVYCNKFTITYEEDDGTTPTTTTLNETAWTFNLAESSAAKTLTATVKNKDTDATIESANVTWESSDDDVATVDEDGNVTPVAEGTATITAKYDGETNTYGKSQATCAITVENYYSTIDLGTDGAVSFTNFSPVTTNYNSNKDIDFTGNDSEKYRWSTNNVKKANTSATALQLGTSTAFFDFPSITSTYGYVVKINYTSGGSGKPSINDGETTKTIDNNTDFLVAKTSAPLNILNNSSNVITISSITITAAKLSAPTITLASDTYTSAQTTTITTDVVGGQIYYTTDGSDPTAGTGILYSGAVAINNGMILKAAVKLGNDWGYVSEATYVIKPNAPTLGTEGGNFYDDFNLTITADDDLTIRYTTNGDEPTSSSTVYTTGVAITGTTTVKAKAFDTYNNASDMVSATYTKIKRNQELAFANASYIVNLDKTITITATHDAGDGAVTYSSGNEEIATVNETTGAITPVAEGTVTITATAAETAGYYEKTATYTLNVYPAGTVLKETFASSLGNFTDDGNGAWTYSTYARGTTYSTSLNIGSYEMVSPEFDLTGMQSALLSFDHAMTYFNSTNGTYTPGTTARIYAKKAGDEEWTEVAIKNDFTASEAQQSLAITNNNVTWKTSENQNLSDFVGGKAQIKFVITTSINSKSGNWFIKNLLITASESKYYEPPTLTFENAEETMTIDEVKTITASTNSNQTISYASDDTDIASVDASTGEVTAKAAGTAHITASVSRNEKWEAAEVSYTLTVNKKTAEMSFDPTSLTVKTTTGVVSETLPTLTITPAAASEVRYSSSDEEVATVDASTGEVTAVKAGIVTITAAISDHAVWNNISTSYSLTLGYSDAEVAFAKDEYEVTYGESFTSPHATKTTTASLVYSSENPSIASVNETTGEVTIHAVGVTVITASAAELNPYNAGEAEYLLTVKELTSYPAANETVFEEHFANCTGTNEANKNNCDNTGWTFSTIYNNSGAIRIGTSSNYGSAKTPVLNLSNGSTATLSFKAAGWGNGENSMQIVGTNCEIGGATTKSVSGLSTDKSFEKKEYEIVVTGNNPQLTFQTSSTTGKIRVLIDDVVVNVNVETIPVSVGANKEWVSYSSPYVLDFTNAIDNLEGAYYVNGHEAANAKLTVTKVTGKVPAKTGLLLHITSSNEAQTINIPVGDTGTALSGNMLVGVLSPTYIYPTEGSYTNLGLSNGNFVGMNNPGVIGANKAYLQILTADMPEAASTAKYIIVIDNNDATGIENIKATLLETDGAVYDLTGRKVADKFNNQLPKGLYIVNGKKYLVK